MSETGEAAELRKVEEGGGVRWGGGGGRGRSVKTNKDKDGWGERCFKEDEKKNVRK